LCQPATRNRLAAEIERAIEAADEPPRPLTAAAPLNRRAICQLRPLLLSLAEDLRADDTVNPAGVAIVRQLLRDGHSPRYAGGDSWSLRRNCVEPAPVCCSPEERGFALDSEE